jgi:tetratricopeptide (TPR) repeat protein
MLRDAGRVEAAIAIYRKAVAIAPEHPERHVNLAKTLALLDRQDAAEAEFRRALALDPNHIDALNDLGNLLCDTSRSEAAINCFTAALRLRPDDAKAHNNLGRALGMQDRYTEAAEHPQTALRSQPGYAKACSTWPKCWRRSAEAKKAPPTPASGRYAATEGFAPGLAETERRPAERADALAGGLSAGSGAGTHRGCAGARIFRDRNHRAADAWGYVRQKTPS